MGQTGWSAGDTCERGKREADSKMTAEVRREWCGEPKKVGLGQGGTWLQVQRMRQRFENSLGYFMRSHLKNQTKMEQNAEEDSHCFLSTKSCMSLTFSQTDHGTANACLENGT